MAKRISVWFLTLVFLLVLVAEVSLAISSPFIRIESGPVVSDGGWSFGVSWVDYDGDTYPDLFVCNEDFTNTAPINFLYHNRGDGTYSRVNEGDITTDGGCLASTWADFDADGDLDCAAARPFLNQNLLYVNSGDGTFKKDTSNLLVSAKKFSMEVEWVDYDNDGRLDMFVANHGRPSDLALAMLYHSKNGVFTLMDNTDLGLIEDEANSAAWADYDGDGDRDLFWSRNNKLSLLFVNNGNGGFTQVAESVLGEAPAKYHGSWADYDSDGDLDVYTKSGDPGIVTLYINLGNGHFKPVPDAIFAADTGYWTGGYWGDYDNDGYLDLFIVGQKKYEPYFNRLYRNLGNGSFIKVTEGDIAFDNEPSHSAAWADHDRDGDLDLFVANVNNVNNTLYENSGNSNHWLQIKLEGTLSNRSGIGAKIRVKAALSNKQVWQMREISSKTGFMSQSELVAHFGLGDAAVVDSVVVNWPSDVVQILTDVDVNQYLRISETKSPSP